MREGQKRERETLLKGRQYGKGSRTKKWGGDPNEKRIRERWAERKTWEMKRIFQPQILPALVCMATLQKGPREVFLLSFHPRISAFQKKSVKIANQTNVTDRENASVVPTFRLKKEGNHFLVHPLQYIPPSGSFCLFPLFLNGSWFLVSFFHFR